MLYEIISIKQKKEREEKMIAILITVIVIEFMVISYFHSTVEEMTKEQKLLKTENYSLKRVLRENDLIPEKYMKKIK